MIKEILKTPSEVYSIITEFEPSGANINVHNELVSYYNAFASMSALDYSLNSGSTWIPATLGKQFEPDIGEIYLTGKPRDIKIVWAAAEDLNATSSYENVVIRQRYNESGSADATFFKSASLNIDFRPSEEINLDQPFPRDNQFGVSFKTQVCVFPIRQHYVIQYDTTESFATQTEISSLASQDGWLVSSSAFPAAGAITATSSLGQLEITYSSSVLLNLDEDIYYFRVSRSLYEL